ncbi:chloroplast sensor kinase, chloroplastic [Tanacetum coccineum]
MRKWKTRFLELLDWNGVAMSAALVGVSSNKVAMASLCQQLQRCSGAMYLRPCNASHVLSDLVDALEPLALKQQRAVQISQLPLSLEVAVEEPALRQAVSNLIEGALLRTNVGGMVEIVSTSAPASGALIIIDDDGPDMQYIVS